MARIKNKNTTTDRLRLRAEVTPAKKSSPVRKPKKKRSAPGVAALREIRRMQKDVSLLIPRRCFQRLVREIAQGLKADSRFQPSAINALQEAAEAFTIRILGMSNMFAIHARRVTLMSRDMHLAKRCSDDPV